MEIVRVTRSDGTTSRFVLEAEFDDGRLQLRPDTSWAAIRERDGSRDLTPEEWQAFLDEHGPMMLPPDGDQRPSGPPARR